jgi:hypothetical protein
MRSSWTRESIIHELLEREAKGLPLTVGGAGINRSLYGATRRIFGSWRKAVVAAGVNPTKLQRVIQWNRERVIEAILKHALRNEPLAAELVDPRSLVAAGQRFFGIGQLQLQQRDWILRQPRWRVGRRGLVLPRPTRAPGQRTIPDCHGPGSGSSRRFTPACRNSRAVAMEHYLQLKDAHFERAAAIENSDQDAAQKAAQSPSISTNQHKSRNGPGEAKNAESGASGELVRAGHYPRQDSNL